ASSSRMLPQRSTRSPTRRRSANSLYGGGGSGQPRKPLRILPMLVPAWPAEDLRKARIERRVGKGIMAETSETIAIIGCGLIGESWSALFTAYGHDVTVWDPALPALAPLLERVESARRRVRGIGAQNTKKEGHL